MSIPFLPAPPTAAKNASGTLMTNAHGQLMTRNVNARYIHVMKSEGFMSEGMIASASADMHTTGVYAFANRVMNLSVCDLRSLAFSISASIFETDESLNSHVVLILSTPERFIHPLMISSPSDTSFGMLSPVNALVSIPECPSRIIPSIGILSPALTTIMLPVSTSSGLMRSSALLRSTFAYSGLRSINAMMFLRLRSDA